MAAGGPRGSALDPGALVRVLDEFVWRLRREGLDLSLAQAIDAVRIVEIVGVSDLAALRHGLAAIVVQRAGDRARYETVFHEFFGAAREADPAAVWDRLYALGYESGEIRVLRGLMERLAAEGSPGAASLLALFEEASSFDRSLWRAELMGDVDLHGHRQLGFRTHKLLEQLGVDEARGAVAQLRSLLSDSLGSRGLAMGEAMALELERVSHIVRDRVRARLEARNALLARRRSSGRFESKPFASLEEDEIEEVRAAVRRFAQTLRGGMRVRARRARHQGVIDAPATVRLALRTAGVPFDLVRKRRQRRRPKLIVLCDVSESVREAARFLLEFAYLAQELFERGRTFVFVSDISEATSLFERKAVQDAIEQAWHGATAMGSNSNYGRVLRTFEARCADDLDRNSTVVILGDGRNNYGDPAPDVLDRIRRRAGGVVWLCPEPRERWGDGDSAMTLYAPRCTAVHEVCCVADLEVAARTLVRLRRLRASREADGRS